MPCPIAGCHNLSRLIRQGNPGFQTSLAANVLAPLVNLVASLLDLCTMLNAQLPAVAYIIGCSNLDCIAAFAWNAGIICRPDTSASRSPQASYAFLRILRLLQGLNLSQLFHFYRGGPTIRNYNYNSYSAPPLGGYGGFSPFGGGFSPFGGFRSYSFIPIGGGSGIFTFLFTLVGFPQHEPAVFIVVRLSLHCDTIPFLLVAQGRRWVDDGSCKPCSGIVHLR